MASSFHFAPDIRVNCDFRIASPAGATRSKEDDNWERDREILDLLNVLVVDFDMN